MKNTAAGGISAGCFFWWGGYSSAILSSTTGGGGGLESESIRRIENRMFCRFLRGAIAVAARIGCAWTGRRGLTGRTGGRRGCILRRFAVGLADRQSNCVRPPGGVLPSVVKEIWPWCYATGGCIANAEFKSVAKTRPGACAQGNSTIRPKKPFKKYGVIPGPVRAGCRLKKGIGL